MYCWHTVGCPDGCAERAEAETTEVFQASKVTGVVLDELGEPVIGVTVRVKNDKRNGTITNADGRYVISVSKNATLIFSYIGYRTQEVAVKGRNTVNVTLSEDSQMLEETVVIGYGSVKNVTLQVLYHP